MSLETVIETVCSEEHEVGKHYRNNKIMSLMGTIETIKQCP